MYLMTKLFEIHVPSDFFALKYIEQRQHSKKLNIKQKTKKMSNIHPTKITCVKSQHTPYQNNVCKVRCL